MNPRKPPETLSEKGIPLGYSLEHEHKRAPIGFAYTPSETGSTSSELDAIIHTGGGHLMTIAPTGSGKGVSCIVPALLHYDGPVIVIDPKGENYEVTARRRKEMGQSLVLIDPFQVTADQSSGFNPFDVLLYCPPEEWKEAASTLAELLVPSASYKELEFFNQMSRILIAGILIDQVHSFPEGTCNLEILRQRVFRSLPELRKDGERMKLSALSSVQESGIVLTETEPKVLMSIMSTIQAHIGNLTGELLNRQSARSTFDVQDIIAGNPLSIFLVLPPERLASHRNLLRLWVGVLMSFILKRRHFVEKETLFILDEAAQMGTMDHLRQAITLLRGFGLQTWSFWQDISQLQRLYPDWETLVNNCRVLQVFGCTNMMMAESTRILFPQFSADHIMELDSDELLLQIAGDPPVISQRLDYLSDPAFKGMADANSLHQRSNTSAGFAPRNPQRKFGNLSPEEKFEKELREALLITLGDLRNKKNTP